MVPAEKIQTQGTLSNKYVEIKSSNGEGVILPVVYVTDTSNYQSRVKRQAAENPADRMQRDIEHAAIHCVVTPSGDLFPITSSNPKKALYLGGRSLMQFNKDEKATQVGFPGDQVGHRGIPLDGTPIDWSGTGKGDDETVRFKLVTLDEGAVLGKTIEPSFPTRIRNMDGATALYESLQKTFEGTIGPID